MKDLNDVVGNIIVTHPTLATALKRHSEAISTIDSMNNSKGFSVVGPSGVGKTTFASLLQSIFPSQRTEEGLDQLVIYCSVPPKPTLKGLALALLSALNDPFYDDIPQKRGRSVERELTARCIKLIKECKVKAIIFDECQHLTKNPDSESTYIATDWLKTLMDNTKVVVIVMGLDSTIQLFQQNEQLARRFSSTIKLRRFDWFESESRSEFLGVLQAFQENLPQFEFPVLTGTEMSFRFYSATGGLLAYIAKLLNQTTLDAIHDKRKVIEIKHLEVAYEKTMRVSSFDTAENPFSDKFKPHPTLDSVNKAQTIGAHVPAPRQRKNKKVMNE
ncbi:MAG: TniB family NTP-binding protein [Methylotenera sp.]